MRNKFLAAGICLAVAVLLLLGLRDIRRFTSASVLSASSSRAAQTSEATSQTAGNPEEGNAVPNIRFVKNPALVPPFTFKDLEGSELSLANWRGKVVLVNFWATWCPPCREEIPDLIRLQAKYEGKLQILGLSEDSGSAADVARFVKQNKMNYPVAISLPEVEAKFGGVMGLPTSFVVDTEGRVVQKHIGLRNPALYETEIRALLAMPVQTKVETFQDNGQVFLSNAKNATELPGVDLSKLTADQKKAVLRQLNETICTCNCGLTLAQCRVNDTNCQTSEKLAKQVVEKAGKPANAQKPPEKEL